MGQMLATDRLEKKQATLDISSKAHHLQVPRRHAPLAVGQIVGRELNTALGQVVQYFDLKDISMGESIPPIEAIGNQETSGLFATVFCGILVCDADDSIRRE